MTGIPVIVCIDVEPDEFFLDRHRPLPWRGYERAVTLLHEARRQFEGVTSRPVAFNWFFRMDPQIAETYGAPEWAFRHYDQSIATLVEAGDAIGVHTHAYRWSAERRCWIIDQANEDWIRRCIDMSCHAFERATGQTCTMFRFGDRWMSNEAVRCLEARGVRYDLTVEPGHPPVRSLRPGSLSTGAAPDYTRTPATPYQPSRADYRRPTDIPHDGLWMIPMSTAPVTPGWLRRCGERLVLPHRMSPVATAMLSQRPSLFRRVVGAVLARSAARYLAVVVRSNAFASLRLRGRIFRNLKTLRDHPLAGEFTLTGPVEALRLLRSHEEPCSTAAHAASASAAHD